MATICYATTTALILRYCAVDDFDIASIANASSRFAAPVLRAELAEHFKNYPATDLIFPGRSYQTKGKQIYSRRRFFEMIQRKTAFVRYMEKNPGTPAMVAWRELKKDGYPGGVKLTAKDLRAVFGTVVMDNVRNADTARRLMRHTSLQTTTRYMRLVKDRMQEAVKKSRSKFGGRSWRRIPA